MISRETLLKEFDALWESIADQLPQEGQVESYGWVPDYAGFLGGIEQSERQVARQRLDPLLFVFEVAVEWLVVFCRALEELVKRGCDWALVPSVLTANAHIYGAAVHWLIVSGFDFPARALLRSLLETLDVCIVAIDDSALAKAWAVASDSANSKEFWHKHLTSRKLNRRIEGICARLDKEAFNDFMEWRSSARQAHSQAVHLTSPAAYCTLFPSEAAGEECGYSGIFGKVTASSIGTLRDGAGFIFCFALVAVKLLAEKSGNPLKDAPSEVKATLVVSKEVLQKLIFLYWQEDEGRKGTVNN